MEYTPTEESIAWTKDKIEKLRIHAESNDSQLSIWNVEVAGFVMNLSHDTKSFGIMTKDQQSDLEVEQMHTIIANFVHLGYESIFVVQMQQDNTEDLIQMQKDLGEFQQLERKKVLEQLRKENGWEFSPNQILNDLMTERALLFQAIKENIQDDSTKEKFLQSVRNIELQISEIVKENKE